MSLVNGETTHEKLKRRGDCDEAAECLDHLQTMLWEKGEHAQDDDISSLICMLQSPLFRQLLTLQDSIQELEQVSQTRNLTGYDFDFVPELQLGTPNQGFEPDTPTHAQTQSAEPVYAVAHKGPQYQATAGYTQEVQRVIEVAARGREVETIKLFKPEKQSLGFSVVTNAAEGGIFVQELQPGGIADRHGRLRVRDQILAIDGQPLDISQQQAIRILQSAGGLVELIVARGPTTLPLDSAAADTAVTAGTPITSSEPHLTATAAGTQQSQQPQQEVLDTQQAPSPAEATDMLNTEWTQIEVIDLINDGTGLGFGIIGGRSTGVVVKTILPGGVADVDGRLHSGDHILQIGDVNVRGMGSEQVAAVLRQSGSHVRLIVARPIMEPSAIPNPHAPIVPTLQLDEHIQQIMSVLEKQDQMIIENQANMEQHQQQQQQQQQSMVDGGILEQVQVHQQPADSEEMSGEFPPEVDYFDVNLLKDSYQGLGITIAGYVGRDNNPDDLCGIFVKSITEGSAAAQDGQIQVNDQIIEVDGQSLQGFTNHQAVEVLRNTGQVVHLKLARYQHGAKFEKLQQYLAQPQMYTQTGPPPTMSNDITALSHSDLQKSVDAEDAFLVPQNDIDGDLSPDVEAAIAACWEPIIGEEFEVVVAQLSKFREGGGLGISLEGTVDVENGVEVRPHHYIRAILPTGPVGVNAKLFSGDELLEVNGKRLLGLNHKEVVGILKELPQNVRLVCARRKNTLSNDINYAEEEGEFSTPPLSIGVLEAGPERLVKSKSDNALSTEPPAQTNLTKKSRSLEPLTGLAMWSGEPVVIELRKGDKGLGFSILDYQDPVNPNETVIVIRSLVPGGVAQTDGRLVPGDRLVFVNDVNLESATLDEAVQALKGAQKGLVRIGVAKPLPFSGGAILPGDLSSESDIMASVVSPQFASLPSHEHDPNAQKHNYMNIDELNAISLPPPRKPSSVTSTESEPSEPTVSPEPVKHKVQDSFYASDEEDLSYSSPVKSFSSPKSPKEKPKLMEKPAIKPRPVPVPRKQDSIASVTSYENDDVVQDFKAQADEDLMVRESASRALASAVIPPPQEYDINSALRSELEATFENPSTDIKQLEAGGDDNVEVFDYENSSFEGLPTYEEATGAEFFNLDDLDAPPVPAREDSHQLMSSFSSDGDKAHRSDISSSDEHKTPIPSPRKSPPQKKAEKPSPRPKPTVPPKPTLGGRLGSPEVKEEPPPLPFSSPPQLLPENEETKASPTAAAKGVMSANIDLPGDFRMDTLDTSSSSEHTTKSDLKVAMTPSPSTSPRTASPSFSPVGSPSLMRSLSGGPDVLPPSLERRITLKRSQNNLGITVEASDKGINGCIVKSLVKTGAIYKDGNIHVGDHIMSINNESMRRITNTQARVILRRASLMGSADISINYVTAADAAAHRENVAKNPPESPSTPTMMPSPKLDPGQPPSYSAAGLRSNLFATQINIPYQNSTLSPALKRNSTSDGSNPSSPLSSPRKSPAPAMGPQKSPSPQQVSPRQQKETVVVGSGNQTWGPPRLVQLHREPGKTLGISIVGGRVDMFHLSEEHMISGIFIKHVLEDSPAGRNGTLKTGDRILQVDGKDLRNATHDQAVETIRHASNPVKFVVQSLTDPACPRDLETDNKSVHSYDEATMLQMQPVIASITQSQVVEPPVQTSSPVPPVEAPPPVPPSQPPTTPEVAQLAEEQVEEEPSRQEEETDEYGYSIERIERRYGDLNGDLLLVDLTRGTGGLGISLAGNKDRNTMSVFVAGIQPESAAYTDGRIQVGDELLEVNGQVLYGRSHLNASAIIKGLNTPIIKFVLLRRDDNLERMAVKPLKMMSPVLPKQQEVKIDRSLPVPSNTEPATLGTSPSEETKASSPTSPSLHDVIQVINLVKGPSGLGFAIIEEARGGRQGIYVRSITTGGVANRDGQLAVGDQILEVQDKNLQDVHYDKAIEILRNSQGTVRLKVRKTGVDGLQLAQNNNNVQDTLTLPGTPGESSTDTPAGNQSSDASTADPFTCPIIPGQETYICIEKGRTGLGLSIVGGADTLLGAIIIHEVYEDGAAARDGRLWAGDQVLEVNNENLREATHDYAIQVLRQTPATVKILVFRDDSHVKEEDIYDIFNVELLKKPGKGLGLSIVGKRNDVGVYISDIVKGGASEADGRLMQGDQILAVNGEDMRNATQEYAAAVLKTTMGKVTLNVGRLKAGSRTSSRRNSNSPGTALRKSESTASNKSKGRHSKKGSEDMSHIRVVELEHDANGSLGLSIAGGKGSSLGDTPIMVANLTPGGPAEKSRKLKVGDKILSINGTSTDGLNHDQVIAMLKSIKGPITFHLTQGEQTPVSVSRRTSSNRGVQPDVAQVRTPTPQENNVFDDEEGPPPQCKTITLERGPDGLGFSIVGGHGSPHGDLPIYVKNVFTKGAASENGQLKRGDQILSVNSTSLEGLTHEEAVNILKNAKGSVILNVLS